MTEQEALNVIDRLLRHHQLPSLKNIQQEILLRVWEGTAYREIARELGYDPDYLKQVAAQLWKTLSTITGEKVSKKNVWLILKRYLASHLVNLGEAIPPGGGYANNVSQFYGREEDLQTLTDWIWANCRVVGIFGLGDVGKTALSVKLAQQLEPQFQYGMWRSLQNVPTPKEPIDEFLPISALLEIGESSIVVLMQQLR